MRTPIRRAQLLAPFGVGAMITTPDGTSLIASGLDFRNELRRCFGKPRAPADRALDQTTLRVEDRRSTEIRLEFGQVSDPLTARCLLPDGSAARGR